MKRWVRVGLATLVVVIAGVVLLLANLQSSQKLSLGSREFNTTILRTTDELRKGLSGTKSLAANHAMVFVFEKDSRWGIWMKDMNYAIDIVWLDNQFKVVHLVQDAQPSSYPETIFTPQENSRYVIELASGTIEGTGVKKGDLVTFRPEI